MTNSPTAKSLWKICLLRAFRVYNFVEANTACIVRDAIVRLSCTAFVSFAERLRSERVRNRRGELEKLNNLAITWQSRFSLRRKVVSCGKNVFSGHVWLANIFRRKIVLVVSTFSMVVERSYGCRFAGYCATR